MPILAGNLLQAAYSFVNAIWVGRLLGKDALAAVTVSFPVIFVLIGLAAGLTLATNILISQYAGARNWPQVRRVVQSSTLLVILVSLGLLATGELLTVPLLKLMHTDPQVLVLATGYMRLILLTMPASFGMFMLGSMLRGIGDSTTPLKFQLVSVIMTALLDPLLMFGWLGFPRLGLNGTAVATIVTNVFTVVALALYLHRRGNPVSPHWGHLRVDWETWKLTFLIGLPSAVQQSLVSSGMVFVLGLVNTFGANATAAFGAASRIDQLAFLPAMSVGMAISTLVGQNIGANRYDRIPQVLWWGILLSAGFTLVASFCAIAYPHLLLALFTTDVKVTALGEQYLRIVGPCYTFFAIAFASNGVINGAGYTVVATAISLITVWGVRVWLSDLLLIRFHRIEYLWYAMAISFAVSMLLSFAYYLTGHWKRPLVRNTRLPDEQSAETIAGLSLDNARELD